MALGTFLTTNVPHSLPWYGRTKHPLGRKHGRGPCSCSIRTRARPVKDDAVAMALRCHPTWWTPAA